MPTDTLVVESVKRIGLMPDGSHRFSGHVVGEPDRKVEFRADRVWAKVILAMLGTYADTQFDVNLDDVIAD